MQTAKAKRTKASGWGSGRRYVMAGAACAAVVAVLALFSLDAPSRGFAGPLPAMATLSTAAGDGQVSVDVGAYGDFGYETFSESGGQLDPGDAVYDPVGPTGPSTTTWESALHLQRQGVLNAFNGFVTTGLIGSIDPQGGLPDPGFDSTTATSATSSFSVAGLDVVLVQSVADLLTGVDRTGSILRQEYTITNPEQAAVGFEIIRYFEGDLGFGGAVVPDGGGHLFSGSTEFVFETDVAGSPSTAVDFVGITAEGGTIPVSGRYEVNEWSAFPERINQGLPLGDVVYGDGPDADEFVDAGNDYDVGIALANDFVSVAPGASVVYTTNTIFGSGVPEDVTVETPTPTTTATTVPGATETPTLPATSPAETPGATATVAAVALPDTGTGTDGSGPFAGGLFVAAAAAAGAVIALGGAVWHVRRRRVR